MIVIELQHIYVDLPPSLLLLVLIEIDQNLRFSSNRHLTEKNHVPTNKFNFTRTRLEDLVNHQKNKRLLIHDTTQPGLAICVTSTGNKSFQLHYWDKQRRKSVVMTLGRFPSMHIRDARRKAAKLIVDIEDGIDVKQVAKSIKTETIFSDMFSEWIEKHAKPHKRSWQEDTRRYLLYMKQPFGNKPISWLLRRLFIAIATIYLL